jgi:hypothetical protein
LNTTSTPYLSGLISPVASFNTGTNNADAIGLSPIVTTHSGSKSLDLLFVYVVLIGLVDN